MLFPQNNPLRCSVRLDGLWQFRRDLGGQGETGAWAGGFAPEGQLAVLASWNDQFTTNEMRRFIGTMLYQNTLYMLSESWGRTVRLRAGAVSFQA